MKRRIARISAVVSVLMLGLIAGVGAWGSGKVVTPPRRDLQDYHQAILATPLKYGLEISRFTAAGGTPCLRVEPAAVPGMAKKGRIARDMLKAEGITLNPWGEVRGTIILLHGHIGRKEDHLPIAERFCAAGFRCIIPDLPGHGEHPDGLATFGHREAELVETIAAGLGGSLGVDPGPLALFGVSQGGAIALQTAARPGVRWFAVASVAAFASLDRPIGVSARGVAGVAAPFAARACGFGIRCRAGFFPSEVRPVDAARNIQAPVFIAHGKLDDFIPLEQAHEILAAVPHERKHLRVVEDGGHHTVLANGSHALYAELSAFYLKSLP